MIRRLAARWHLLTPVAIALALALPHLDQGDFRTDTQWYSAIGLQAWRTGHLWTLYADPGQAYFNKPPLVFWIHGLALWLLGPSLVVARLPTVLAAVLAVLVTSHLARRCSGRVAGLAAGIALALTIEFIRRTREISIDMWQALFMVTALALVATVTLARPAATHPRRLFHFAAAGGFLGLALLCKPLMALIAVPVFTIWLMLVTPRPQWRTLITPIAAMSAVALLIGASWPVSMAILHGQDFISQHFGREIAQRAQGLRSGVTSPLFYIIQIASTYWPWLLAIPGVIILHRRNLLKPRDRALLLLAALWAGTWLILLSIFPDRRDRYALPIWPALALMVGLWAARVPRPALRAALTRWAPRIAAIALLLGGVLALAPIRVQRPPDPQWLELFRWYRQNDQPQLWEGGIIAHRASRLYVEFSTWPIPTRHASGARLPDANPPQGALLLYHREDGLAPGPGETVIFETTGVDDRGRPAPVQFRITRLDAPTWRPVETTGHSW